MKSWRSLKDVALKTKATLQELKDRVISCEDYKKDIDYMWGGKDIYVTIDTALELKYHFLYS